MPQAYASIEPETGQIAGSAVVTQDNQASGGNYVQFGTETSFVPGVTFSGDYHTATATGNLTTAEASDFTYLEEAAADRFQLVTSPKQRGDYAVKVTVEQNDVDNDGSTDRDEMSAPNTTWGPDDEIWLATAIYLDPTFPFPSSDGWAVVFQLFGETGGESSGSPPFAIEVSSGGAFLMDVRGGVKATPATVAPINNSYYLGDATTGVWHDFMFHIQFSTTGDGQVQGWEEPAGTPFPTAPVATATGPNVLTVGGVVQDVYPEVGLYRSTIPTVGIVYDNGTWVRNSETDAVQFFDGTE